MSSTSKKTPAPVIDLVNDEDVWDALDEAENVGLNNGKGKGKEERRPIWMPEGLEPILEELPKWNLLSEVIQEAEEEIIRQESFRRPITAGEYFSAVLC
jgi:DNA excision repair protein ERCC-4